MARNHNFHYDNHGIPRAGGPASEKPLLQFLETDIQGSDSLCRVLMDDIEAIQDGSDDEREFIGNAHSVSMTADAVTITSLNEETGNDTDAAAVKPYTASLKHFREVVEDWEVFIMDDQFQIALDDDLMDDDYS